MKEGEERQEFSQCNFFEKWTDVRGFNSKNKIYRCRGKKVEITQSLILVHFLPI